MALKALVNFESEEAEYRSEVYSPAKSRKIMTLVAGLWRQRKTVAEIVGILTVGTSIGWPLSGAKN